MCRGCGESLVSLVLCLGAQGTRAEGGCWKEGACGRTCGQVGGGVPAAAWESSRLGRFPPESGVQGRVGEEATGGRKWREGVWRGRSSGLGEVSWRGCGASSVTWLCRSPPVLSLACIAGRRKGLLIKIMDTEDDKHRCNLRPERISH